MANKELALYTGSNSTYNLGRFHNPSTQHLKTPMWERKHALLQWLHLPSCLHSVVEQGAAWACGPWLGPRHHRLTPSLGECPRQGRLQGPTASSARLWKVLQKSVCVTPLGNTIYSCSYTIMGVQKPDGKCGKGLLHKLGRGKGPTTPVQKSISKETAGSSSHPLRFKRTTKLSMLAPSSRRMKSLHLPKILKSPRWKIRS